MLALAFEELRMMLVMPWSNYGTRSCAADLLVFTTEVHAPRCTQHQSARIVVTGTPAGGLSVKKFTGYLVQESRRQ